MYYFHQKRILIKSGWVTLTLKIQLEIKASILIQICNNNNHNRRITSLFQILTLMHFSKTNNKINSISSNKGNNNNNNLLWEEV